NGDTPGGALLRQGLGEPQHAGLGCGVVRLADLPGLAVDRADVDDAAKAPRAHPLDDRSRHIEARVEVGPDHVAPLIGAHPVHRRIAGDSRVVDQPLDRASELCLSRLYTPGTGVEISDIEFEHGNAGIRLEPLRRLLVAGISRRYPVAGVLQRL